MKAIVTKYLPATNTRGARIKASDGDNNTVTVSYSHDFSGENCHRVAADALCKKMNWKGKLVCGWIKNGQYAFVFTGKR